MARWANASDLAEAIEAGRVAQFRLGKCRARGHRQAIGVALGFAGGDGGRVIAFVIERLRCVFRQCGRGWQGRTEWQASR